MSQDVITALLQRVKVLEDELDALRWERDRYRDARDSLANQVQRLTRPAIQPPYVQAEIDRDAERRRDAARTAEANLYRRGY